MKCYWDWGRVLYKTIKPVKSAHSETVGNIPALGGPSSCEMCRSITGNDRSMVVSEIHTADMSVNFISNLP